MIFIYKDREGFSMIEALVAIAILVLVITSITNVTRSIFEPLSYSQARVTADFLALEALETTRYIRDINLLEDRDWLEGLESCFDICDVSVLSDPKVMDCSMLGYCENLGYEENESLYGHDSSWSTSSFSREVKIIEDSDDSVIVSVKVKWPRGEVKISEMLYNFR